MTANSSLCPEKWAGYGTPVKKLGAPVAYPSYPVNYTHVVYYTEDSGHVEEELSAHHHNLRQRLDADHQALLQKLRSLRESEAKRLQTSINDLETSRLELHGLGERLNQLVSYGSDADIIRENFTQSWKASGIDERVSGSGAVLAFRKNSLLSQLRTNVIGQIVATQHAANNDGKLEGTHGVQTHAVLLLTLTITLT